MSDTKEPFREEGNYRVTVLDVSHHESPAMVFGVAMLLVEESDNPRHPPDDIVRFVWRKGGFDYSELKEHVGKKLYVQVKAVSTRSGTLLAHTFTTTAPDQENT